MKVWSSDQQTDQSWLMCVLMNAWMFGVLIISNSMDSPRNPPHGVRQRLEGGKIRILEKNMAAIDAQDIRTLLAGKIKDYNLHQYLLY